MNKAILHLFASLVVSMCLFSCAQEETWDALTTKGRKAQQANRLVEAEDYFLRALHIAQDQPDNDKQLSKSFFRLGMFYHYRGFYPEADYYYRKTLALRRRLFGSSHRRVATCLSRHVVSHCSMSSLANRISPLSL